MDRYPRLEEIHAVRLPEGFLLDGRFRVRRALGEGGVGAVFEADQVALGRRVAVKVLHPAYVGVGEIVARFRREAVALARLPGPHVVSVIDVGDAATPEGVLPYIAMELLEGETLAQRLARGRMGVGAAARAARQALEALAAVHKNGMLHRDLKPENIFLARGSDGDVVKLVDFGLSRPSDEPAAERLTRAGLTLGTPLYMAPEQARGDRAADHRADLFAVGVTLYEMLTGQTPFDGPNYAVVLNRVMTARPTPPRTLRPEVPEALEQVVLRALEKDPEARFADASAFAAALGPFEDLEATVKFSLPGGRDEAPTVRVPARGLWRRIGWRWAAVAAVGSLFAGHAATTSAAARTATAGVTAATTPSTGAGARTRTGSKTRRRRHKRTLVVASR